MKGPRLIVRTLTQVAFALTVLMTALNLAPSWSQLARSLNEPLLLATIPLFSFIFLTRSFTHPEKDRLLYRLIWNVRLKHVSRMTALFFWGIVWTPVTHPAWWIQTLHLAFTFLAIASMYSEICNYYRTHPARFLGYVGLGFAALGMVGGLYFKWWTVGVGELMAAFPGAIHVLNSNK